MLKTIIIFYISLSAASGARAQEFDHSIWNSIIKNHVININETKPNQATAVDYSGILKEKERLEDYLKKTSHISKSTFDSWSNDQQLAFLINIYNAATIKLVLSDYPNINSIRDLGSFFNSPFRKDFISLFDDIVSLDNIEKDFIFGSHRYNDPRVHFALNCASISCPALRREAYNADQLNTQLNDQMQAFLSDKSRNRLENNVLRVSKIFSWYDDEFENGWQNITSLKDFFAYNAAALNLTVNQVNNLRVGKIKIRYLDYNWNLNKIQ